MKTNPLRRLADFGQSIWLDDIRRQMIIGGELARLIEDDGLRGVTSDPAIFDKAIAGSHDYDGAIRVLSLEGNTAEEIYDHLAVEDVRNATDLFRKLYDESEGRHGFVSLEVSPRLAHDTEATIAEARRLWEKAGCRCPSSRRYEHTAAAPFASISAPSPWMDCAR